ncbi:MULTISPECIES: Fur family transcriptional regulator [unclassified Cetobacterium]|uniref:Fur family transcriptional regulator n=1 Tax=unclassified Cetobacterium TaxID=2630983 RepID=UPI00163D315D|nr:Fur family transcriptional regulator [Cetobacterium sp. 8H]MBC2850827.1 transcriptional repressor [Cetobacterium sp. 8H]
MYIENVGDHLKIHDIKPSYQRIKIFQYLLENKTHPTVDEIYKALCKEIPTLSKTTVYNTLNLFIKEGIARVITIEENETRYDADMDIHGHFKCEECKKVYDIPVKIDQLLVEGMENFKINEYHVYFKGICSKCQNKL